jgi:hypothetical protein
LGKVILECQKRNKDLPRKAQTKAIHNYEGSKYAKIFKGIKHTDKEGQSQT